MYLIWKSEEITVVKAQIYVYFVLFSNYSSIFDPVLLSKIYNKYAVLPLNIPLHRAKKLCTYY